MTRTPAVAPCYRAQGVADGIGELTTLRSTLRVALPMLTLVPGGMGGSETYARALTRELASRPDLDVVSVVARGARGFSQGVREEVETKMPGGGSTVQRVGTLIRGSLPIGRARRIVADADVAHFPFSVPLPRTTRGTPYVQTLLDVQHLDLPELFSAPERGYRRLMYDRPARRAAAVITISEFARRRAIEHLRLDPAKVHVAHLGVDPSEHGFVSGPRDEFILYPARPWPHKNHRRLVTAVELLRRRRPSVRLVLTGGGLEDLGAMPEWVERRGLVQQQELAELYQRASCLVFPSLYEGFGLPPLEAMASGCPVAAASSGSLPEICGDAAIYFDPTDPQAIAEGIERALEGRSFLVERGLARVQRFSWVACAEIHARVYRDVVQGASDAAG